MLPKTLSILKKHEEKNPKRNRIITKMINECITNKSYQMKFTATVSAKIVYYLSL